ncbi:MAG: hypothetical protein HQL13_05995 [Candidatus Omnitrophica bacterium]|nr:hypothetical protein [Candidatus Omnitrophota bacterium]
MKKTMIFLSLALSLLLFHWGFTLSQEMRALQGQYTQLQTNNLMIKEEIRFKETLPKKAPMPLSTGYTDMLNHISVLENTSGTCMQVNIEASKEDQMIENHYENSEYQGIKKLKIQIMVDKFSKESDMGAVLDDIHLLEKDTDFIARQIIKENNDLIVKGEVYGI